MELTEQEQAVDRRELKALKEAFALFGEQTAELKATYARLQDEVQRVNTELEAANRALEAKVRELDEVCNFQAQILASIPTAVVVTDCDGRVNTFNPAAEQMWGVPAGTALGAHFSEVMGEHAGLLGSVLAGQCRRESLRRQVGPGEGRIISSAACLVEDSGGRPIGAIQLDRDITRVVALEWRLCHQEKLADLGQMAAGLAHEIRKPLNGIKGFASLLQHAPQGEAPRARYVSSIVEAADRLNGMLGRLLDFARPDAPRFAPCDLREEAAQVIEFIGAGDADGAAAIELDVPDEARLVVADRNKIKQVLLNLLVNAVEALDGPGSVVLCARSEESEAGRQVRVSVTDTGRGIPADELDRVLDPFYTSKEDGTGLGLAIVSRIVQLHGSELNIESRPGRGTTVAFALPAAPSTERP